MLYGYGSGRVDIVRVRVYPCFTREKSITGVGRGPYFKGTLNGWKTEATRFPKMAVIARSVFSIPASQNKSERAFSAAGHVMTDLRTTLDPDHLDELLMVRSFNRKVD